MVESLRRAAGGRPLGRIDVEVDPRIEAIVRTWPLAATFERATRLGLPRDESLNAIVEAYIEDHLGG